jgi:hypothetical protein
LPATSHGPLLPSAALTHRLHGLRGLPLTLIRALLLAVLFSSVLILFCFCHHSFTPIQIRISVATHLSPGGSFQV